MPERITVNKDLGVIEVFSYGDVTRQDSVSSLATLERLRKETGIKKVLSDTRKQKTVPATIDIFEFGSRLPRDMKIAVIFSGSQPTASDIAFVDNVAYNRGAVIKTFSSRKEALQWLRD